jgi:HAD superfamily hydrolase (TIGR01509 family)
LPGARETLFWLKQTGRKVGICSNKPVAFSRELMVCLGIAEVIDVVLGPEDTGRHKPAPDILLIAMQRLGVDRTRTLYIGDMTVDIQTARAAGVTVWVVATGTETAAALDAARPDRRLTSLTEVADLLAAPQ